jgi:RNA polymerase sigma-70 factor (ECF subfamily)
MPTTTKPQTDLFTVTRWSVVLAAGDSALGARGETALAELCQAYWFPVYAYLRRKGHGKPEAEDLTQAFFAYFLENKSWQSADPERGRFRAFLMGSLQHFLCNAWDREQAQRRGSGIRPIELDALEEEKRGGLAPAADLRPELAFDREWAQAVAQRALERLRQEYLADGREMLFEQLQNGIANPARQLSQADLASCLGMSENAVKVALHRLRKRYRLILREEVAQTTATPAEVEAEIRHLLDCLRHEG